MGLTRKVYLGTCAKGQHFFKNDTKWVILDRNGEFLTCQNTTTDETKEFSEVDILRSAAGFGGVVTWHSNGYFFINTKTNTDSNRSHVPLGEMLNFASFTVVGNNHDNPTIIA